MAQIIPQRTGIPPSSFISLSDTPGTYVGAGSDVVQVNVGETDLEFVTVASILALGSFLDLFDTPASYVGQSGNLVRVNAVPDGLEFVTPASTIAGVPIAPSGFSPNIRSQNSDAIQTVNDYTILIDASLGNRQVTILSAIGNQGRILNVKKIDATANIVTLLPVVGGQTIDGSPTYVLTVQYQSVTIQSDNANWFII